MRQKKIFDSVEERDDLSECARFQQIPSAATQLSAVVCFAYHFLILVFLYCRVIANNVTKYMMVCLKETMAFRKFVTKTLQLSIRADGLRSSDKAFLCPLDLWVVYFCLLMIAYYVELYFCQLVFLSVF